MTYTVLLRVIGALSHYTYQIFSVSHFEVKLYFQENLRVSLESRLNFSKRNHVEITFEEYNSTRPIFLNFYRSNVTYVPNHRTAPPKPAVIWITLQIGQLPNYSVISRLLNEKRVFARLPRSNIYT